MAAGAFATALGIRFVFDHSLPAGFPYLTFFPAVILTTFLAGFWPGVLSAVVCGFSAWYWFIAPYGTFEVNASVMIALAFYVGIVTVDILLIQFMHRAMEKLRLEREVTRDLLERQNGLLEEQRLRQRDQRILQRELAHRMKNTLAMVQAVVSQTLRNASSLEEASLRSTERIQALSRAQDMLTETDWQKADIRSVVEAAIEPHADGGHRFAIEGPPVDLTAQQGLGISLAVHELATNATKYGALSNEEGRVTISWSVDADGFHFRWSEAGGPAVVTPQGQGFGTRLTVRVVPTYFSGTASLTYPASGLLYQLDGVLVANV
ncbi:hypothetical protein ASG43_12140 [Aureimonas sp. Leaf454]|uniref:sensor histidine kinase n=1 Tax=Aureimonas sp. Leaf454 TaxID=1736381 RepID=UPI0006FFD767|nr:HWE histidine kinase domain-containing protein [Aureimonas sp. Leaf454]KQT46363.1 hypothetical protein ASG43_12140 [Aureimonas sp. Leaf454]